MSKTNMKRDTEKRFRSKLNRKHWRDYRLHELEKQLEFAESRCGTLKEQLDYIKILYGCGKSSFNETDFFESFDKEQYPITIGKRPTSIDELSRWNSVASNYQEGKNDKCFLPQTMSCTNTTRASTNSTNKAISSKSSFEKEALDDDYTNDCLQKKSRASLTKVKRKKPNGFKNKLKSKGVEATYQNATCQTTWPLSQDPVVEIYKNIAANIESESAADVCYKSKRQKLDCLKSGSHKSFSKKSKVSLTSNEELIPATKLNAFTSFKSLDKVHILKEESVQTETISHNNASLLKNEKHPSTGTIAKPVQNFEKLFYDTERIRSYCQPTISSKKKRVERNILANLNNINLKNIPFIAATSTAPSHNIGVNIQQVLSIMKKRQPNTNNDIVSNLSEQIHEFSSHFPGDPKVVVNELNQLEGNQESLNIAHIDSKNKLERTKSNMSDRKISEKELLYCKFKSQETIVDEAQNPDWMCKVHKLKKVLVFLHEDFTTLSQKYKKLQKKLTNRNINKRDAKGELSEIEKELERKEEEITIVISLYKEVLHLKEELKKYQDKYNFVVYERALMMDGIKQSSSTHTQMAILLRKIQQFQDQLKR